MLRVLRRENLTEIFKFFLCNLFESFMPIGILFLYPFFSSCFIQGGFCLTELKSFLVKNDFSRHLDIKSWIIFEKGVSK